MSMNRFFLDNAWRRSAGLPELELPEYNTKSFAEAENRAEAITKKFFSLMKNRLKMGYFRYENNNNSYPYTKGIEDKLNMYIKTKNLEYLVDAANYALLEFNKPTIEGTFFEAVDDCKHLDKIEHESNKDK